MIKVLIADDHRLFRKGIITLLREFDLISIAGEAESGSEMIQKYFELKPDILLADISMPDMSGVDALEEILNLDRNAKALFLSMHEDEEYIYRVYRSGGKGLISKNYQENEIPNVIQKIYNGGTFFGEKWSEETLSDLMAKYESLGSEVDMANLELLSAREKEVFRMIGEGNSSIEIAEKLFISKRTVDHHREKIKEKLGAKSFHEVFKSAVEFTLQNRTE